MAPIEGQITERTSARRSLESTGDRAYLFVLASVEYLQSQLAVRRHVSGEELSWCCRDFAIAQFGPMARTVLEHWGVARTDDLGRIVFTLVEVNLLVTQPGDREEDFAGRYEFAEAFGEAHVWSGSAGR